MLPKRRRRELLVAPETVTDVAGELADELASYAVPYLSDLVESSDAVLSETAKGWLQLSVVELTRHLIATEHLRGRDPALELVREARRALAGQNNPAAAQKRSLLDGLMRGDHRPGPGRDRAMRPPGSVGGG